MMSVGIRCLLGCVILASMASLALQVGYGIGNHATLGPQFGPNRIEGPQAERNRSAGPQVELETSEWDFGSVPSGEILCAKFRVSNKGTRRLILDERGDCCGSANQEIIPPGESKELTFVIHTSQRQPGPGREVVCYETNDRHHSTLVFTMVFDLNLDNRF
jgi:hypothetical protein